MLSSVLLNFKFSVIVPPSKGLLNVTNGELKDAGIDDAGHRETILTQLSRHRQKLDPHAGNTYMQTSIHNRAEP